MEILARVILLLLINVRFSYSEERHEIASLPLAAMLDGNSVMYHNSANCFFFNIKKWEYIDLYPLSGNYTSTIEKGISFNFCVPSFKCNNQNTFVMHEQDGMCKDYAGGYLKNFTYNLGTNNTWELTVTMDSHIPCAWLKENFTSRFHFQCANLTDGQFIETEPWKTDSKTSFCIKELYFLSNVACPKKGIYPLWWFYISYNYIIGSSSLLLGVYISLIGNMHMKWVSYFYGLLTVDSIVEFLLRSFGWKGEYSDTCLWIVFFIGVALGIVLGALMNQMDACKLFVIGGYQGGVIAKILFYVFIFISPAYPLTFYLTLFTFLYIGTGILYNMKMNTDIPILFSTSTCGAFLVIRALSIYGGGLPYEEYLMDLAYKNESEVMVRVLNYYTIKVYFFVWLIISITGIAVQYKQKLMKDQVVLPTEGTTGLISRTRKKSNPIIFEHSGTL